jgi:hypothetical protein
MTDSESKGSPPTYFGNFATTTLNTDELVLELRRIMKPHRETMKPGSANAPSIIPPLAIEEIMREEAVVRVVMTFTAAKALKEYLDNVMPRVEESRQTGKPLQ